MKNIINYLSVFTLLFLIGSCEENEEFEFVSPEDNFEIISPTNGTSLLLDETNVQNTALTIVWQDNVSGAETYNIDMSTDEAFTSPINIASTSSNNYSFTVEELNSILLNNEVSALQETNIYLRVNAGNYNSIVRVVLSSYPEENPIITSPDNTFSVVLSDITPDDTAMSVEWDDPNFSIDTNVNINYYIDVAFSGSSFSSFEVLGETNNRNLDITHSELNTAALATGIEAEESGLLDLRVRSVIATTNGDLERISELITINVTTYTTELPPVLYGVGAGLPDAGWGWASPVEIPLQGTVYGANVNLSPDNGGNFRFFTDASLQWDSPSQNYPWYEVRGYTIDPNFQNANDGDLNFQFIGTAGEYYLEIDTENKTITLGPPVIGANCQYDQLWLVGAGVPDAGWAWTSPASLPCTGNGVYSGNVTFANDSFRFFTDAALEWASPSFNYPYYENEGYSIDSNFQNANDGDSNFSFTGSPGTYTLTVDTLNKTITIN